MKRIGYLLLLLATPASGQPATWTNPFGMRFVHIEAGRMIAGRFAPECPTPPEPGTPVYDYEQTLDPRARWNDADYAACRAMATRDARAGFEVQLPAFYIGAFEVTQDEWVRVMGSNPSVFQGMPDSGSRPVDRVTWEDAQRFIDTLNRLDTATHYRLPTELEWEYAARAGIDEEPSWAALNGQGWIADVDLGTTHPVGRKAPNAWGVYDTVGNVWEWVSDFFNDAFLPDPVPPASGTLHVLKGGSFTSDVKNATPFGRGAGPGNGFDVGFRVVAER